MRFDNEIMAASGKWLELEQLQNQTMTDDNRSVEKIGGRTYLY